MNLFGEFKWYNILIIVFLVVITIGIILLPQQNKKDEQFCQSFIDQPIPTKPIDLHQPVASTTDTEPKHELILYYATWCGNCTQFVPTWTQFDTWAKDNLTNVRVSSVRCEDGNEAVCAQKGIKGYPTVMLYLKSGEEHMFEGPRTMDGLKEFIYKYTK
jgi:thioredoxin-like negative regulator of GroEL